LSQEYGVTLARPHADLGGSSNLNLLVTDGKDALVARVYRRHVTAERLAAIQTVRRALAASGVPAPVAVPTRVGKWWTRVNENLIEVEPFVASDAKMDDWPRIVDGLRALGAVHSLLARVELPEQGSSTDFANYASAETALSETRRGTARIRAWGASGEELRLADGADRLAEQVTAAERDMPDLPRQVVHGDYWDNNILFRAGALALLTDFDFMGVRPRLDDLALPLFYSALVLAQRGVDADGSLRELGRLVDAYDSGLEDRLSESERVALPLALCRQPLWSFAVWIANLDDERAARAHAAGMRPALDLALSVSADLERWRSALV
jgi:Ser/Thr protein kinase RdoA (MazF antagonist)